MVQCTGSYLNEDFIGFGSWIFDIGEFEDFWTTVLLEDYSFHMRRMYRSGELISEIGG